METIPSGRFTGGHISALIRVAVVGCALTYWRSIMTTSLDNKAAQSAQRAAMLRMFGGVLFAFLALLAVAAYVRPDLMKMAMDAAKSMMP
jgi:hypothetical protein